MSLRRGLTIIMMFMAGTAFAVGLSLTGLTNYQQHISREVADAIDSIRLVQQLELDLLAYDRSEDPTVKADIESRLRQNLVNAERFVDTNAERESLKRASAGVATYLQHGGQGVELRTAMDDLGRLLDINTVDANEAQSEAARWNRIVAGAVPLVVSVLVLGVMAVLYWIWRLAFQPVLSIRDAMVEFASGRRTARASERGPDELRSIAVQFNQMAQAISRQYENQLVFLTGVAHDLRNPLSPLRMSASILGKDGPLPSEERIRSILSIVTRQVERLDRMIGDLLDSARIEAGQLELRFERQDARQLAQGVFELFRMSSSAHEIVLRTPPNPVWLHCDGFRIEQVLNNLVSNAIKYSPHGGRVQIVVEKTGAEALLQVSDNGVGIHAEDARFIFEPFRRIRSSEGDIPGIGLGLSITRRIVEAHNGRIELSSEPGKGATFRVYLPLDTAGVRAA